MKEPPEGFKLRLLFILHRGFVETRLLAGANRTEEFRTHIQGFSSEFPAGIGILQGFDQ
jgi:hypothetical protein